MKSLAIDPVFSSWVNVIRKAPILNCSNNCDFLNNFSVFFSVYLRSLLFSNCELAMFDFSIFLLNVSPKIESKIRP